MANLTETSTYTAGVYQIETTDPVLGGSGGIANSQAQALANRTKYLLDQVASLSSGKQPLDATLTALAALVTAANKMIYSTGADAFALADLTDFARTLLDDADASTALSTLGVSTFIKTLIDDADAATARGTLGAASLASPTFTGTPAAPTATAGTNTTQIATTAFVASAVSAGATTLNSTATDIKMNGTQAAGSLSSAARADHVHPSDSLKAPIASPTFTGTPAAPTPTANTNTTQLATTAFVLGQASVTTPAMNGTAAVGTGTTFARADHVHPTDTSKAPLASPAFTGNPTAPTASQFDNDTSLATTAFVQQAIGNARTYTGISGTNTLTAADSGAWFEITAVTNLTLPNAVTKAGMTFKLNNTSSAGCSVSSSGGNFYGAGLSGATSYELPPGMRVEIFSDGANWKILFPGFACRAWVNFNGTGTVAIRASGNVSSITDNGTGDYTVNFTTAMPDANYSIILGTSLTQDAPYAACCNIDYNSAPTSSGCKIRTTVTNGSAPSGIYSDMLRVCVSIFR